MKILVVVIFVVSIALVLASSAGAGFTLFVYWGEATDDVSDQSLSVTSAALKSFYQWLVLMVGGWILVGVGACLHVLLRIEAKSASA